MGEIEKIDWENVWTSLPEIMGLDLRMHGHKWYGKYRIDGSPHTRWDKLVIQIGKKDGQPIVLEQGGESCTLWSWLSKYANMKNSEIFSRLTGAERKPLVFDDDEYVGPVRYVEPWQYIDQGGMVDSWHCPLFLYLSSIYGNDRVSHAFKKYNVSTGMKRRDNGVLGTRFWFIDRKGRICHDKTMFYGKDGHRLKDCPPMRMYKKKWGFSDDCFFGEDSLLQGRPVFVVESEKTAIIASLEYPGYNWVASAGKNCLSHLNRLDGFDVYLVPDVDAVEEWSKFGKIWDWWRRCGMKVGAKWDIGDFLLAKRLNIK